MDNRSSFGVPRSSPPTNAYGGVLQASTELAVNRLHGGFTVSGSLPIAKLTPLDRGTTIFLYCTGAPTFLNSALLVCPGGQNYIASPGDVVMARSLGDGAWRLAALPASGLSPVGYAPTPPQGRLTLTSGTAVPTNDVAAATTVCYTPAVGRSVPIWNSVLGIFVNTDIGGELSQSTTDTTKSPAAVANNSNYDKFVWNDAGTIRCTRGPAWSSDTARGTGAGTTELILQNGFLVNKNDIVNGPAAGCGIYVGTIRSNGSATIDMKFGSSASGGGTASLCVWNAYNQVMTKATVRDSTASWSYTSNTIRQVNGSNGNRINFLSGLAQHAIYASYNEAIVTFTTAQTVTIGLGMDITGGTYDTFLALSSGSSGVGSSPGGQASKFYAPQIGFHYVQALEASDNTHSASFNGGVVHALELSMPM